MTIVSLTIFMCLLAALLISAASPLMMTVTLFLLAMFISLFLYISSTWLGLTLFLIYIGGVMVMFSYFIAVMPAPDSLSLPSWAPPLTIILLSYLPLDVIDSQQTLQASLTQTPIGTILNTPLIMILLAGMLLLALIVVVKTATRNQGALRPHL